MSKRIKREQWDEIQVAFDRRNGLYVAYSTDTGIVGSGVCVPSAVATYKSNYYERQENLREEEYQQTLREGALRDTEMYGGSLGG